MSDNYLEAVRQLEKDCDQMGRDFVSQLKERTGETLDVQGIPVALAAVFDQLEDYSSTDVQSFFLKDTLENFIGMRLERYAPGIELLHQKLTEIGATSFKKKVNNGGDNYIYCLPATFHWRYTLVCETQNRLFIVLMRYGSRATYHPDTLRSRFLQVQPAPARVELESVANKPQPWDAVLGGTPSTDEVTNSAQPQSPADEEIEKIVNDCYRPQIYIAQFPWVKSKKAIAKIEGYANMNINHLPDWANEGGYVAFLKDGQVEGAIHHYTKISYCFFSLSSFIECRDMLRVD
jgi:hypothetical protein